MHEHCMFFSPLSKLFICIQKVVNMNISFFFLKGANILLTDTGRVKLGKKSQCIFFVILLT